MPANSLESSIPAFATISIGRLWRVPAIGDTQLLLVQLLAASLEWHCGRDR